MTKQNIYVNILNIYFILYYYIMAPTMFTSKSQNPVNYDCPVCQKTGKLPNLAGRFFIINEKECQCNGCDTVFDKTTYYKKVQL